MLDAVEPGIPLDLAERLAVEEDLADLARIRVLADATRRPWAGSSCATTATDHYHDWDMLRANLQQLLADGTVVRHTSPRWTRAPRITSRGITAAAMPTVKPTAAGATATDPPVVTRSCAQTSTVSSTRHQSMRG